MIAYAPTLGNHYALDHAIVLQLNISARRGVRGLGEIP